MEDKAISYVDAYNSFHKGSNYMEKFVLTLDEIAASSSHVTETLSSSTNCMTFGPGSGCYEIHFIKRLMPNLRSLSAAEPDKFMIGELQKNMRQHLSHVKLHLLESKFQDLMKSDSNLTNRKFGAVLMFHVLYFSTVNDRHDLYRKLSNEWLEEDGLLFVCQCSRCDEPGSVIPIIDSLCGRKGAFVPCETVESELTNAGFDRVDNREFRRSHDFSGNVGRHLADFFGIIIGRPVQVEELDKTIHSHWPSGKSDNSFIKIVAFQKSKSASAALV